MLNNNSNSHANHSHFYIGLLAGGIIGAIIAYLSSHKKGGQVKKQILLAAKRFSKHLPEVLDQLANRKIEDEEPQSVIKQELTKLKNLITAEPEPPPPPPTLTEKITATVKNTTKSTRKFFSRAGKKLK